MTWSAERLVDHVRRDYQIIYQWHREHGLRAFVERCGGEELHDNPSYHRYLEFLHGMPRPDDADLQIMDRVAREVLQGCMEWSYGEQVGPDLPMYRVAERIRDLLSGERQEQGERNTESSREHLCLVLRKLNNVGEGSESQPLAVEIQVPPDLQAIEGYGELARIAYADVAEYSKAEHLGGAVALADTNMEHEGGTHRRTMPNRATIRFRNAKAMHFKKTADGDELGQLARKGTLSILSVKIGG